MRLRKINLVTPQNYIHHSSLFVPRILGLPSALTMHLDKVTEQEKEQVIGALKENYRFSRDAGRVQLNRCIRITTLFFDYSTPIADCHGRISHSAGINREAAFAYIGDAMDINFFDFPLVEFGSGLYAGFTRSPDMRGGVPPFENGCAYLEVAPSEDFAKSRIHQFITEFETPRHQEVLEKILKGEITEYHGAALFEHLRRTGREELWTHYGK